MMRRAATTDTTTTPTTTTNPPRKAPPMQITVHEIAPAIPPASRGRGRPANPAVIAVRNLSVGQALTISGMDAKQANSFRTGLQSYHRKTYPDRKLATRISPDGSLTIWRTA
jgi:hypothetical protein